MKTRRNVRARIAKGLRQLASRLDESADDYRLLARREPTQTFVGFIDLLGFGHRVEHEFQSTLELYDDLTHELRSVGPRVLANVRLDVLSDSILLSASDLASVVQAVRLSWSTITRYEFLARGGIAVGLHVEASAENSRYIVSQALVRAVQQEKAIKHPCVALCDLVPPPEAFVPYDSNIERPLLWYEGSWIVNPLSLFWGTSAIGHAEDLLSRYPAHRTKYEWFIELGKAVLRPTPLIPTEAEYRTMLSRKADASLSV